MCLYPRLLKNPKYKPNKKNGGVIPPVTDPRTLYVPIGCTQCMECRKQKARNWQVRLLEDLKQHTNGKFITLTFSNQSIKELHNYIKEKQPTLEGYELDNEIATLATRRFLERWRKHHKTSIRHWLVTELGHNGTENIHLHGILWTNEPLKDVEAIWQYGFIWKGKETNGKIINYVNERTINYVTKYVTKKDEKHKTYNSILLVSPGIGANYTQGQNYKQNTYSGTTTDETYRTRTGHKIALPIYWRNKIYTDKQKELLWLHKLDKQERWVGGERVSTANGMTDYFKLLQFYRQRNAELGYGTNHINWNRAEYEKQRRHAMLEKRIAAS